MQKLLIPIFLCCFFSLFSQTKKVWYLDENRRPISEKEYRKGQNDHRDVLHLNYQTDTARMFVIVRRENRGILQPEALSQIRQGLEEAAGVNIDPTHILVIDYYPGKDDCNSSGIQDPAFLLNQHRQYLKRLYTLAPLDQFNIYSDSSGLQKYTGLVKWYPDVQDRIKKTFFPLHYPCGSFVVIHPNGHFHAYNGEYANTQVFYAVRTADGKDRGVLHSDSLRLLRNSLEAISQTKIDPGKYLVIDYYPGKDICNSAGIATAADIEKSNTQYLKTLYATAPVQQFSIYRDAEGLDRYKEGMKWYPDTQRRVETTFFPVRQPCFSAVVIAPDGTYRAIMGEHQKETVRRYLEEMSQN